MACIHFPRTFATKIQQTGFRGKDTIYGKTYILSTILIAHNQRRCPSREAGHLRFLSKHLVVSIKSRIFVQENHEQQ